MSQEPPSPAPRKPARRALGNNPIIPSFDLYFVSSTIVLIRKLSTHLGHAKGLAPDLGRAMDHAAAVEDPGVAIACEKGRSIEIDDVAQLPDEIGRRHREAGAHHVADHDVEPERPRLPRD